MSGPRPLKYYRVGDLCGPDGLAHATADEARTLGEVSGWIRDYLMSANPDLGRVGAVCPYTPRAAKLDTIRVGVSDAAPDETRRIESEMGQIFRTFDAIESPPKASYFRTVITAYPNCIQPEGIAALQRAKRSYRFKAIFGGRMTALFYAGAEEPGLWNKDFRPLRSPIPLLIIREMVAEDAVFAMKQPLLFPFYLWRFPTPGAKRILELCQSKLVH